MTEGPRPDAGDMLARVGYHWGWLMAFGVITFLAGMVALAWPGPTLIVVPVLFGVQLVVTGIFRIVAAAAVDDLSGGGRVLLAVLGLLSLIIGLYAVRHVLISLLLLAVLLGIFWIINGITELFLALSRRDMAGRGWTGLIGAFSIVAGLIVLADPGISLLTLAIVLGVWLLVLGAMEITLAVRAMLLRRHAGARTTAHAL
jgi:uncharacterized membrane protein HdeD (DUF308 family)